jgi:TadE-like protein
MDARTRPSRLRLWRQERGGIAVEFALIIPALLLLVFGIVDFGHAWYMDHLLSNASREGARYGTRFVKVGNDRLLPQNLTPSISDYVKNTSEENGGKGGWGLAALLPTDANSVVTPTGPGWTETVSTALAGKDLTVTVTARKSWFVIGKLIPGLGSYKDLSVRTTMKCE